MVLLICTAKCSVDLQTWLKDFCSSSNALFPSKSFIFPFNIRSLSDSFYYFIFFSLCSLLCHNNFDAFDLSIPYFFSQYFYQSFCVKLNWNFPPLSLSFVFTFTEVIKLAALLFIIYTSLLVIPKNLPQGINFSP